MAKTNPGRFFEDYRIGEVIAHAVPRTVSGGERALYHALYPARHALYSSDEFARASGLPAAPDRRSRRLPPGLRQDRARLSLNAVANLGYAEGRWLKPVYPGDTLRSESQVIGLKQNSNGKSGVVWVRTTGTNQDGEAVLDYIRWVMVRKRDLDARRARHADPRAQPALAAGGPGDPRGPRLRALRFHPRRRAPPARPTTRSARRSTMSTASPSRKPSTCSRPGCGRTPPRCISTPPTATTASG